MKQKSLLNRLFKDIEDVVLRRQHPVTGLLPASTSINTHGDYTDAWVRDNVYSVLCVWGLAQAERRFGKAERCDQLEQATIKLMRGLLMSMMRQAAKVETFKHTLKHSDALHAKYDTASGLEVVADDAWGHLQVDATSLYLLILAQMSASGLRIVRTFDEVDFVQNLVYYIASAYRTPDFGIWERGNKINNGKTEINASSVGMAKAALQALDRFNLFGKDASPRAVIHSVADAISMARNTLAALLPRESHSKETDSALLSIIGFPAFAVGDKTRITQTRDDILAKLGGNYGCKRFLWDGHQTALEESSRLYYEHSELANFENVESEWPLFFCYLYIHALFDGNESTAQHYRQKLDSLMVEADGIRLLPELYYVPAEAIDAEKRVPHSQTRLPNDNIPLVWAQSLYWVGYMLDEGLLTRDDLDPLKMRHRSSRASKSHIALVVLAENDTVKAYLAKHGIIAETTQEIEPIKVISAPDLVEVYTHVGANKPLRLTGRPRRRLQSLATSETYEINGRQYLCLSWRQGELDDYRNYDAEFLARSIQREIAHIRTHWLNPEVAVFTWRVDEHFCHTSNAEVLFETLRELQLRTRYEHVGYASANFALRASRLNRLLLPDLGSLPSSHSLKLGGDSAQFQNPDLLPKQVRSLLECLEVETDLTCYRTLEVFLTQQASGTSISDGQLSCSLQDLLQYIYAQAQRRSFWLVSRYCYAVLGQFHIDLADGLTMLAARHLSVVIGKGKVNTVVIDAPESNAQLIDGINRMYFNPLERTLVQEVLAMIGNIMRTEPRLFDGLRSIQVQNLMMLCAEASDATTEQDILLRLGALSPAQLKQKVRDIFDAQNRTFRRGLKSDNFLAVPETSNTQLAIDTDWFEWRVARGSITRLNDGFLKAIWQSLSHAHTLVFGDRGSQEFVLDCDRVRSSMTAGEAGFANLVDQLTQQLHPTYYKSAVLEALYSFTQLCKKRPEVRFDSPLLFAQLLEQAAKSYIWDEGEARLGKRDLDVLLEQPPEVLQRYVEQALENLATRL